jgi:hypothetical protein
MTGTVERWRHEGNPNSGTDPFTIRIGWGLENPGGVDWLEPFVGSAGEFGPGTPVRGVSRARERLAPGVATASAAPGWQDRPAFGVPRCQTAEIWRIQKCQ